MTSSQALIAGAGIGGLCAALGLAKAGWKVRVFEQAEILQEAGAGLQLSPNASVILKRFGVLDDLLPASLSPEAIRIRRAGDGAALAVIPLKDAEARWGAPYLVVHRGDLHRALVERARAETAIDLCTGCRVTGFAPADGFVEISIQQGANRSAAAGDVFIGADGSRSRIRDQMLGREGALRPSRRTAWRSLVAAGDAPASLLRPETGLWLGRKAHLVHYPLRGGSVVNVVAIVEEDSGAQAAAMGWSTPGDAAFLEARFSDWEQSARALLHAAPGWRKWPLFDRDPIPTWIQGRAALLGDAAHPMLPFLAQGAAQAIEDAGALVEALSAGAGVERALLAYQTARRARAGRVQLASRRQGELYHLSGPAALARDLAFRAIGGRRLLAHQDWLYAVR
ncbi:FAD-dependent monooxygenase [Methylocapsa palsarum]|uniref:Salicylate hydroxylase n=1 Tax=Methylocapsa palsarum TaxID=1612308 RepID=A0A1I3WSX1_9HYPH|nr:FAD-dependent monooxygenase [Methylocapsa palsarum]SFK10440.1 salicylate hydroxylase [Methylocapsa palsarum]